MKLRQDLEDFKVEEISEFVLKDSGAYKLYLLEKRGMETFYLLAYLAKQNGILVTDFGIAGMKDKHAITKQYLTIPADKEIETLHEKNFDLNFLGYVDERLKMGSLEGNKFEVTVRNVKKGELEGALKKAKDVEKIGVPNYFDSQRFGSVVNNHFIVKHVLKRDYEAAVKTFLTLSSKSEYSRMRKEKIKILQNWGKLEGLDLETTALANVVAEFKKTGDWAAAYRRIPTNIRKMFVSAYQSYLWNECVKLILKNTFRNEQLCDMEYAAGSLVFHREMSDRAKLLMPKTLTLVGPGMGPANAEKEVINTVLAKEGVSLKDFDIKKETGDYFGVRERQVIVMPKDFRISEPAVDELNDHGKKNTFKITLSFSLPKGCYATIVTKRIFNR